MKRVLTALVLVPLLLASVKLAPPWVFVILVLLTGLPATLELCSLLERRGRACAAWLAALGTAGVVVAFTRDPIAVLLALAAVLLAAAVTALFRERDRVRAADSGAMTLFAVLVVGLPLGFSVALRYAEGRDELGQDLILLGLLVVYLSDTAAYYGGRAFGRHRLFVRVSPAKTWEGAFFGLLGGLAGALAASVWFFRSLPVAHALVIGVLLVIAGILGDLAESVQKRAADAKDSGGLLPGHGGMLDRLDSLLFAAPVLYAYHRLVLSGL